ncbi:hypothetical protein DT73_09295 [Mangrovibacter sp. MFB070]|uniref:hypothetical protein n=1 Tax=Mangrovibacter sp. MFB070 TaxID=1224318 RepID=UPI0004D4642B|nr:hypothetical protein [Mangrovibacter sp. MFB070]KEA52923.1 hypothetical protein DT73_09295 [Mangrovibacter sp. MFB070]
MGLYGYFIITECVVDAEINFLIAIIGLAVKVLFRSIKMLVFTSSGDFTLIRYKSLFDIADR